MDSYAARWLYCFQCQANHTHHAILVAGVVCWACKNCGYHRPADSSAGTMPSTVYESPRFYL